MQVLTPTYYESGTLKKGYFFGVGGIVAQGGEGPVSDKTLNNGKTTAAYLSWGSALFGDAALWALKGMPVDAATGLIKGIGTTARFAGYAGMALSFGISVYDYRQNPTWGNFGRMTVIGTSAAISMSFPGYGTALGLGGVYLDAMGAFNGFYNYLDANQNLYNNTGSIMIPSGLPSMPFYYINIK